MNRQGVHQQPINVAINDINSVKDLDEDIAKLGVVGVGSSYRTRARMTASLVYDTGLLSTISYLYAKATKDDKKLYDRFVEANTAGKGRIKVEHLKNEQEKLPSKEELAHAAYLYHVLAFISSELGRDGQEKDPIGFLKTLAENPVELGVAESLLRPFLIELKHLAEAVFEAEK
ncbi:MAG: type III-B CRISPR module-associated protein Cmr5 [Nitrososphaeria archaeon]